MREPQRKFTAAENGKIIVYRIKQVISQRFPELIVRFNNLPDNRLREEYSMAELVTAVLFMFILKQESRNAFNSKRRDVIFAKNYYRWLKLRLPHNDATDEIMRALPADVLEDLKAALVSKLIEQKLFRPFRYLSKYYCIAVDATGIMSFDHQHCEKCIKKESSKGVVTYFHYVLEAKLVTSKGHAISIASEFIMNELGRDFDKQDCELKAFIRLAEKIKMHFPRLPVCILADSLYPNQNVFKICRDNQWQFIINLKDGSLKTVQTEVSLLNTTAKERIVYRSNKTENITINCKYLNEIEYHNYFYSWVQVNEKCIHRSDSTQELKKFVYITSIKQCEKTIVETADTGRLRWKIENEGFNTQKNGDYELEHKFSRKSLNALQNYYQMLQIAHMINQFVEKSADIISILNEHSKQTLKALWEDLMVYLRDLPYTKEQLEEFLTST